MADELNPAIWPAWVQAIGSVAAIFFAIGLAWWEHRRQQARTENEKKERARGFIALASATFIACEQANEEIGKILTEFRTANEHQARLAYSLKALESIPAIQLPNLAEFDFLLLLLTNLKLSLEHIKPYTVGNSLRDEHMKLQLIRSIQHAQSDARVFARAVAHHSDQMHLVEKAPFEKPKEG